MPSQITNNTKAIPFEAMLETLNETYPTHPMGTLTAGKPYYVLISCLLSLRTKDDTTMPAAERLLKIADTPQEMIKLSPEEIQKLIYPVGFYRNKSHTLIEVSQKLLDDYEGEVPNTVEELLNLKGVGRKTANLVVGLGHKLPAVCVDVHVHRICQRVGYLENMKDPEATEMAIRKKLDKKYWPIINKVLVRHGQEICKPIGARCDVCPIENDCAKIDVKARKI